MEAGEKHLTIEEVGHKAVPSGSLMVGEKYGLWRRNPNSDLPHAYKYLGQVGVEVKLHTYNKLRRAIFDMVRTTRSDTGDYRGATLYAESSVVTWFRETTLMNSDNPNELGSLYVFVSTGESLE